ERLHAGLTTAARRERLHAAARLTAATRSERLCAATGLSAATRSERLCAATGLRAWRKRLHAGDGAGAGNKRLDHDGPRAHRDEDAAAPVEIEARRRHEIDIPATPLTPVARVRSGECRPTVMAAVSARTIGLRGAGSHQAKQSRPDNQQ